MLVIRLKRIGKKHQASFRVVVGERRSKLKGDYTEDVGWYSTISKKGEFKADRIKHWMSVGAQLSPTVHNLLISQKVIEGKKIAKHKSRRTSEDKKEVGTPTVASGQPVPTAVAVPVDLPAQAGAPKA